MNLADSHFEEFDQRFQEMLARLTPECRTVLVMHDLEGHKSKSIAKKLQVPLETVRHRLNRARRELRDLLQQEAE
jgi:RNA polymerase sigma-70 factor (ECF subfamily)